MPKDWHVFSFIETYVFEAGSSPTKIAARVGGLPNFLVRLCAC